jgi:hypothetical protein
LEEPRLDSLDEQVEENKAHLSVASAQRGVVGGDGTVIVSARQPWLVGSFSSLYTCIDRKREGKLLVAAAARGRKARVFWRPKDKGGRGGGWRCGGGVGQ